MLHRPDLGFRDQGRDLAAPDYYASVFRSPGEARSLPPAVFHSLAFAGLEDAAVWSQTWVCVGSHADVPHVGDLLPYTVGTHGLHVQRTDRGLVARYNKAQHGGCRTVPVQCQQGTKTRCSFTSCGHSRDRAAIPASLLGDDTPEMHQYLGLRPDRLFLAATRSWGPLVFVSLAETPAPLDAQLAMLGPAARMFGAHKSTRTSEHWLEFSANWKLALEAMVDGAVIDDGGERGWLSADTNLTIGRPAIVYAVFPNLVMLVTAAETCAVILQPTALGRTLCRVSVWGEPGQRQDLEWRAEIVARGAEAERRHAEQSRRIPTQGTEVAGPLPGLGCEAHALWWQRALAHRVLSRPAPAVDVPVYDTRRASGQ